MPKAEAARHQRALELSLWEGVCATVMLVITETFAVPAALSLSAPALTLAVLASLPLCLGTLGQLVVTWRSKPSRPRRPYVVLGSAAQALLLALCAVAGLAPTGSARWLFVAAFIAFATSGHLVSALWISWMRDLAPAPARGRLFAKRNRVFALVQLGCGVTLGILAHRYASSGPSWTFFLWVFAFAAAFRAASSLMLRLQYEPERRPVQPSRRSLRPRVDFVRFCTASALLQAAVALSGPFFTVWFLTELHFDYLTLVLCNAATLLGSLVFLPIWGRIADRTGSFRLLLIGAVLVAALPFPYLVFSGAHAIWILNFCAGAAWSAYNLGNFNALLESVRTSRADREIALAVAAIGVAVAVFGLIGGALATQLPPLAGSRLRTLFLVSGLLRVAVVWFCFRRLGVLTALPAAGPLPVFDQAPSAGLPAHGLRAAFRALRRH